VIKGSYVPSEETPNAKVYVNGSEDEEWLFNGVNYYPYYKDYDQAEWFSMPVFSASYPILSFRSSITSGWSRYDPGLSVNNSYFLNPILVCWNPPVYPYGGYRPGIPIFISVGSINNGSIKESGITRHGPRSIGPNRTGNTNIRNHSANVVKLRSGVRDQR
jgi:hypothetical protein